MRFIHILLSSARAGNDCYCTLDHGTPTVAARLQCAERILKAESHYPSRFRSVSERRRSVTLSHE